MIPRRKARDAELIDALEELPKEKFDGPVWRVVRAGRDPVSGSSPGGRWDDGSFDVLYTSAEATGALAETYFHLTRGQPVFPSVMEFRLFELRVALDRALRLADMAALESLGVGAAEYGTLDYARRQEEYRRTQEISEVAHFLNFDGLIVPSAQWACANVVLFTDRVPPDALRLAGEPETVDWAAWERKIKAR